MPSRPFANGHHVSLRAEVADISSADEDLKKGVRLERNETFKDYLVRIRFTAALSHLFMTIIAHFQTWKHLGYHRVRRGLFGCYRCWGHCALDVCTVRYASLSIRLASVPC